MKTKIDLSKYGVTLHLIRHGNYNPTKAGGWSDDNLSIEGIKEVEALLNEIDDYYDVFISSDLNRAKDTSLILNRKLNMDIIYNQNIREINSGILNDMPISEFIKNYSYLYYPNMKMDEEFPNGESPNTFFERIKKEFNKIIKENKNKKVLLVTHSGVINIILCLIRGIEYQPSLNLSPKTGSIIKINYYKRSL